MGHLFSEELYKQLYDYIFPKIPAVKSKQTFDFKVDFRLLWADFKGVYNIDLDNDNINWWEFQALFERMSLLENVSCVNKVIGYRGSKIPKQNKNNKEQIEHLRRMKARYRLEDAEKRHLDETMGNILKQKMKNKK